MTTYKDSLLMGKTSFPMKARLSEREPQWLADCLLSDFYGRLRTRCAGRPVFFLHDGPPYANGDIHMGHAVNKILKDIIIREKTLSGFDAPYVPGWDCHGMPIEIQVEKERGRGHAVTDTLAACRAYAEEQMARQKASFQRLGVMGDWSHPYVTMSPTLESREVAAFAELLRTGCIQRGLKPVNWCLLCESALAEAEVEYQTKTSTAIDVAFRVCAGLPDAWISADPVDAVIWTTTPWTIPGNEAVCVHPDLLYVLLQVKDRCCIVAESCASAVIERYGVGTVLPYPACTGRSLTEMRLQHPLFARQVPCIAAHHVTTEQGTGLVHTAPAHGMDDYHVGCVHHLPVMSYVNHAGYYDAQSPWGAGRHITESEADLIAALEARHALVHRAVIRHAYPHCWRHKTPIIFRATDQWFLRLDGQPAGQTHTIREAALTALSTLRCFPDWGKDRLSQMVAHRPDWCLSRQRTWGVPMTLFIHKETGALHPHTFDFFPRIIAGIAAEGIAYWARVSVADFLSGADQDQYEKLTDTLDVWFDSGMTHHTVVRPFLASHTEMVPPRIDLCVEGSDQHRGWFHSSLLTSIALTGLPPYRSLLTHGFVVDGQGLKMSKSQGNVISPQVIIDRFGADILRLWVASTDFAGEMSLSEEILTHTVDMYRRIRNTIRFLLANLSDFYPADCLPVDQLLSVDAYMLSLTHTFLEDVRVLYTEYRFHVLVQKIQYWASEMLGSFYLDILKDRLYTASAQSSVRLSAQTVLFHLFHVFVQAIAPILPFTAEEAWSSYYTEPKNDSVFFSVWHTLPSVDLSDEQQALWERIRQLRTRVTKALEEKRAAGVLGASLQADLYLSLPSPIYECLSPYADALRFVFMVSRCTVVHTVSDELIDVQVMTAPKCPRCWHYSDTIGTDLRDAALCSRCIENVYGKGEQREFA